MSLNPEEVKKYEAFADPQFKTAITNAYRDKKYGLGPVLQSELSRRLNTLESEEAAEPWQLYVTMTDVLAGQFKLQSSNVMQSQSSSSSELSLIPSQSQSYQQHPRVPTQEAIAMVSAIGKLSTEFSAWIMYRNSVQSNFINNPGITDDFKKSLIRMTINENTAPYKLWSSCLQDVNSTAEECWNLFVGFYESSFNTVQHIIDEVEKLDRVNDKYDVRNLESLARVTTNISAILDKKETSATDLSNIFNALLTKLPDDEIFDLILEPPAVKVVHDRVKVLHKRAFAFQKFHGRSSNGKEKSASVYQVQSAPVVSMDNSNSGPPRTCDLCSQAGHFAANCIKPMNVDDRRSICASKNLCFRCLTPGHARFQCRKQVFCKICQRNNHATPAHDLFQRSDSSDPNQNSSQEIVQDSSSVALDPVSLYPIGIPNGSRSSRQ